MYVLIMITFIDKYMTKRCKKTVITLVEYFLNMEETNFYKQ